MSRRILIDPVTRLEGHGRIQILLDADGKVSDVLFQVPEFRGFEKFCEGRAVEEMPTLTQKICGICPMAHHMASTKTLDDLFSVTVPPAAQKIRELAYHAFIYEDHLLHVYYLGGPDWLMAPDTPPSRRNIAGLSEQMGAAFTTRLMAARHQARELIARISGSALYPVFGLPGGVSKALTHEDQDFAAAASRVMLDFAGISLKLFEKLLERRTFFRELLTDPVYYQRTYSMGMTDDDGRLRFYDGHIRIVDPGGDPVASFTAKDFPRYLTERINDGTYMKNPAIRNAGWQGFPEDETITDYRVGPLARLNVISGISTPLAQSAYEKMMSFFGGRPVHHTLAYHWARLIEILHAAERVAELAIDPDVISSEIRNIPAPLQSEQSGSGVCEAPRGTLFHVYHSSADGIIQKLNLMVGTQHNAAALYRSVHQAASMLITNGQISDAVLNRIEMAYRAYDPCLACATH